jgi:hypothetical protein
VIGGLPLPGPEAADADPDPDPDDEELPPDDELDDDELPQAASITTAKRTPTPVNPRFTKACISSPRRRRIHVLLAW